MKDLKSNDITSRQGKFYLKNAPPVGGMVMIKTDWCSHCQQALPEFEQVSRLTGGAFPIYKLDGDKNKDLVNSMGVAGYPTIKFINPDGQISDKYQGARDKKAILDEICRRAKKCY